MSILVLLAALAAFFIPCGEAGAQGLPDAPLEVLSSTTFQEPGWDGHEIDAEIPLPAGTEMAVVSVSGAARGFSFIDYVSVGAGTEQIAETDGMAALDMTTGVFYRTYPTPPATNTTAEVLVGIDTGYQESFTVVVTVVFLRGADMASFPGAGTAYTGPVHEASSGVVEDVDYYVSESFRRGDMLLTVVGAIGDVGAPSAEGMQAASSTVGGGMSGGGAFTRVAEGRPDLHVAWDGVPSQYSMFMIPLRSRCVGTVQVNIRPQAAVTAGARWRANWGQERTEDGWQETGAWLESGELAAGQPLGVWPFRFSEIPGYTAPEMDIKVVADDLTVVDARYRMLGAPEVLKTDEYTGIANTGNGYEVEYSDDVPWGAELALMFLSTKSGGEIDLTVRAPGFSVYSEAPHSLAQALPEWGPSAETGITTRAFFMKRPQLRPGGSYDSMMTLTPAGAAEDIPYILTVVFLRGVDLDAFSDPWDAERRFPALERVSATTTTTDVSYTFPELGKPINGDTVFSVLSVAGFGGTPYDAGHDELWNARVPGNIFSTAGSVRQFEPGRDDNVLLWDVGVEDTNYDLTLFTLPAAGRGALRVDLSNAEGGEEGGLWRIDGGGWRAPGTEASMISAGWHWLEFHNPDTRSLREPPARWVRVLRDAVTVETGVYMRVGVPHPLYQFSFTGKTDTNGELRINHVMPSGMVGVLGRLTVAALAGCGDAAVSVTEGGDNTFTEWVRGAESGAGAGKPALFFRKGHTLNSGSTWKFQFGRADALVSGAVSVFTNVNTAAVGTVAPFVNTAGGGDVSSPANLLNPLTEATEFDLLCGALQAQKVAALNHDLTDAAMLPARLWQTVLYGGDNLRTGVAAGYTALAAPAGLTPEQQGPTFNVGGAWGVAEAMLPHSQGRVTVTIEPPELAARPEMLWSIAGGPNDYASGWSSAALCGWQFIEIPQPTDYRLTDPSSLWVEVEEDDTVPVTLTYTELAPTGLRLYIEPENAAQGGATWRVKGRTPEDTWHGDNYLYTDITVQDVDRGYLDVEFTGASGHGEFSAPEDRAFLIVEGENKTYTVTWKQYGRVRFQVEPPEAAALNPLWRFEGTETWYTLADEGEGESGRRRVEFSRLPGWQAPVLDVLVPFNDVRAYTVRYEPGGTPRLAGQASWSGQTNGDWESMDVPLSRPLPDLSVVLVTWQRDQAAPEAVSLDLVQDYTLWTANTSGTARSALYYLKNPDSPNTEENEVWIRFAGTGPVFSMQAVCMFFNGVDLDINLATLASSFTGTAPEATLHGLEVFPHAGLYLGGLSVVSGAFAPDIAGAYQTAERGLALAWKEQAEGKALLGGGGLVTGKVSTGGSWANVLQWDCESDWGGVTAEIPVARGSLRVFISPQAAVDAGVKWNAEPRILYGSDSGATRTDVLAGLNTLSHNNVNGWAPDPAHSATATVPQGGLTEKTYYFVETPRGGARVILYPASAVAAGAQWRFSNVDGMPWQDSGVPYTDMPTMEKTYLLEFKEIPGWTSPFRQDVRVRSGEITEAAAMYTQAGALRATLERDGAPVAGDFWIYAPSQRLAASTETISDIPPGMYDIHTMPVNGYLSPQNTRVLINPGETLDIVLRYEKLPGVGENELLHPGSVTCTIEPPEAAAAGARWRLEGYAWANSGQTISDVRPGAVEVFCDHVEGWYPVEPFTTVVPAGRGVTVNAYYQPVQAHTLGLIPEIEAVHGVPTAVRVLIPEGMPPGTVLSYSLSATPDGLITFTPASGVFTYTAAETDVTPFEVTFCATPMGGDPVCQTVLVRPVAGPVTEDDTVKPDNPDAGIPDDESKDYITFTEENNATYTMWNGLSNQLVKNVMVTGKTLRIQQGHANNLYEELHDNKNLKRVQLFAEKVVVAGGLRLPGADLHITARVLVFEDLGTDKGRIDLTPYPNIMRPETGQPGAAGQSSGDLLLNIEQCRFDNSLSVKRFILKGAKGQPGGVGQDGDAGGTFTVVSNGSWEWQDKVKNAGVDGDTRREMVGRVVYHHDSDQAKARGTAKWPKPHTKLTPRGTPGNGGEYGTVTAPFGELAALIDADYGPGGDLYPIVPVPAPADTPSPDPAFWLWTGDPNASGPSAATRASEDVKDLTLVKKKKDDWVIYYYRNQDPVQERITDTTGIALIQPRPAPPLEGSSPGTAEKWICPEVMQPAVLYLKDLYLNGHIRRTRDLSMEYLERVDGRLAHNPPDSAEARLLQALADEIRSMYERAAKGLDYFGNPPGWAPMLSFEANAQIYEDEFEIAIPTLFLARWIEADARRTEKSIEGLNAAIAEKGKEITTLKEDLNTARGKLPDLATKLAALDVEESSLTQQKEALEVRLREQAENEAEDSWIESALKVVTGVLKVLPFPEAQIAGGIMDLMNGGFSWDNAARVADQGITFGLSGQTTKFSLGLDQVWNAVSGISAPSIPSRAEAAAFYDEFKGKLAGMTDETEQYRKMATTQGASSDEVQAILDKLIAKSHWFQQLAARLDALVTEKTAANTALGTVQGEATRAAEDLGKAVIELGEMQQARTSDLRSQDHRARQFFKAMDQRVRHRLLKQHYYMAKAYEFRTLQPYPHPLELSISILNSLMAKVTEHTVPGDPTSPLHGPTLSPAEVTALKTPFEDQMRDIVIRFVDDANSNSPDAVQNYTWLLTPAQLDELNRKKQITINLQHLGRLLTSQDNHRVARIWTDTLGVTYNGGGEDPQLNITYTHSGVSRMRHRGKTLAFQHYLDESRTPWQWTTACDYFEQVLTWEENDPISPDSASMLSYITGGLAHDQVYYCVPSAWADIVVRLDGDRADFAVDQLRIGFEIYYTPKQPAVCDVYVAPQGGLRPPVTVSRAANVTGLQNGEGEFFRQYGQNSGTVTFTTVAQYGTNVFSHWLLNGNPVYTKTDVPSINVSTSSGHVLVPVFAPAPVAVPDLNGMGYSVRQEPPPGTDMGEYTYPVEAYSDAEFKLVTGGLVLGAVRYEQTGDDADKGKVLRQYPTPGMSVAKDTEIHLAVSTGTDPAPGNPLDAAMAALLAAFEALDTDASGGLSWAEALAGYPGLWPEDFDALDTDQDGELSPEELGYVPPLCEIGSRLSVFRMLLLMSQDPNGDAHLTKLEFQDLTGFIGIEMNGWGLLDTNGDDRASMPEFEVSTWTALGPLFELDTDMDNAISLAEYQAFNPALPAGVFNAADLTTPKNGLIDCEDIEFVVVTVPDIVGLTQAEAEAEVTAAGLAVGQQPAEYSDTVPAGRVISQTPLAAALVPPGAMIHMSLSLGPAPVPVPDITGLTQAAAGAALTGAGLVVGQVSEAYNATVPAGSVISQNPAAGTEVPAGTPVSFVVSLGVQMIAVPDLIGMTAAGAESALLGAGLTLGAVTQQNSATVPAGQVMGQTPAAGVELAEGSSVAVVVSLGPLPVAVPNVTGMAQAAATASLTGAGLAVGQVSESYSDTVPAGSVISQNPAAGTLVLPGAAVALEVSKGPAPTGDIAVPNLAGMTQAQAAAALAAADLALGTVTEVYSATVPAGQVVGQSPAAGVEVASGTAVNLTVSKGPEPAVVPDVTGMTQANAAAALTGAGLAVGAVTEAYSDTIPAGRVISQNPEAGAEVPPGTAVRLEVSKGPAPVGDVAVPNLAGLTQAQASAALTGVGLVLGAVTEVYDPTVPAGQVVGQNPAAGVEVAAGTAVNIVLSKGPAPVAVPDVTGMTQANATAALTGAGLAVGAVTQAYHATVPAGSVISQDPAAGTEVAAGSAVDLNVSKGPAPSGDVTVPDLAGMTQSQAGAALTTAGLALGAVTEAYSATVPAGQVMGQSPAAGVPVPSGTEVAVTLSKGPQPVSVPDVTWMTEAAAEAALTGAGLAAGQVTEAYSATVPVGRVISQDPAAGAQTPSGSAVDLVVSLGPPPVGDIAVPSLAGMTQAAATTALSGAGLAVGAVTQQYSATVPAGQVIGQNPAAGTMVASGTAVALVVSRGPQPVSVPDVSYLTPDTAGALITGAGLVVGQTTEECSDVPAGRVVRTDPAAEAEVAPGTVVHVVLSSGPCVTQVAVPNVSGLAVSAAGTALTSAGLVVGQTTEECSDTVPEGAVIRTNPASGTMVVPGTVVHLVVSSGPCSVAVPNVSGQAASAAGTALTGAGLVVGQTTEECSDTVPAGAVIRTNPASGTMVNPGTVVALVVSSGPCPVAVPNVAGMTQAAATAAITGAGLTLGAVTEAFSDTVPAGSVISQSPAAGAQALPGSAVALVVSKGVETGGCGCKKSDMTVDGLKSRLGDLFLGALALALLAAAGRRRMP